MNPHVFKGVDVGALLHEAVSDVAGSIPDDVESVYTIREGMSGMLGAVGLESIEGDLDDLFQWDRIERGTELAKGFPGIVILAIVGRIIDPEYDASSDLYAINPRPLCEKHIGPILRDGYGVPMGKSDVLNVAKAVPAIDEEWARRKQPRSAAMAAVRFIRRISHASGDELRARLRALVWCYLALSRLYTRELPTIASGLDPEVAHRLLVQLIGMAPAGGDTAQHAVGAVLQAQHTVFGSVGALEGVGEGAHVADTTSGKPGDLWETLGGRLHVYEVTTKKVDMQRLRECAGTISSYLSGLEEEPVAVETTFLCDLGQVELEGLEDDGLPGGSLTHQGIRYHFVSLEGWLFFMLERLGPSGREIALDLISRYVQAPATQLRVKRVWQELVLGVGQQSGS